MEDGTSMTEETEKFPAHEKVMSLRLTKAMHRALVIYALDTEQAVTTVIRDAIAAKLAADPQSQQTKGDSGHGQSESKGKGTRKARRTEKRAE